MTSQLQKQKQKQGEITALESLQLVKTLVRVSVYHVSYLRGLFPDSSFKGVDMQNLDGFHIKMLDAKAASDEEKRLMEWVEGGVVDALRKQYLKKLIFGISTDTDGQHVLEEYVFTFSYDEDGGVTMHMGGQKKGTFGRGDKEEDSTPQPPDVRTVKYQVVRLMRMLVQICQTLERVPDERYIFMKLTYYDHVPDDYEPPFFEEAGHRAVGSFERKPFTMQVGRVDTRHVNVGLQVKSVLDSMDVVKLEADPEPDCLSDSNRCTTELSGGSEAGQGAESMGGFSPAEQSAKPAGGARAAELYTEPQQGGVSASAALSFAAVEDKVPAPVNPEALQRVQDYVSRRSKVHVIDAMGFLSDVSTSQLEGAFAQLVADRVLVKDTADGDVFHVAKAAEAEAQVFSRMNSLRMDLAQPTQLPSAVGGMHSQFGPGSAATQSEAAANTKRKAPAMATEADAENGPPPAAFLDGSQPASVAGGRPGLRKTSYVEKPIHQTKRSRKEPKKAEPPKRMLRSRMGSMAGGR